MTTMHNVANDGMTNRAIVCGIQDGAAGSGGQSGGQSDKNNKDDRTTDKQ